MLAPNQINPLQIPRISELRRLAIQHLRRKTGRPVDPKCAEVQHLVLEMILEKGGAWRAEIEQAKGAGDLP